MKKKIKGYGLIGIIAAVYCLTAMAVAMVVRQNGVYPTGSDTMYHIYRGQFLYEAIKQGSFYPLLNPSWYNGVELLRYWAPLPAYVMALCQFLAGGDPFEGYLLFTAGICFFGAFAWLGIGIQMKRPVLGAFLGEIWFFMPNNLTALFVEGNLARSMSMVFLPLLIYQVVSFLQDEKVKRLPRVTLAFAAMVLCHLGYAGMAALAILLYGLVHLGLTRRCKALGKVVAAILLGFLVLGIWLIPSLCGGITSMDNSENMQHFFQRASWSLDPLRRMNVGFEDFYFGCAAFILAVFGGFFSYPKSQVGFWTAILIFLGTTNTAYPLLKLLPGSQYLWMLRFISIALCMILISFLSWQTLKKPWTVFLCVLLLMDTLPSMSLIYGSQSGETPSARCEALLDRTLIARARQLTKQRMALMDLSSLGAMGAYLVSGWDEPVCGTFGAGWEAANTNTNIAQLNRALAGGHFAYLFDRSLELGNDTVLIQLSQIEKTGENLLEEMDRAAAESGYQLIEANDDYRLYHLEAPENWGTISRYKAAAIGRSAAMLALNYPELEEMDSYNLNDYTFEQLAHYETIYLSGFSCDDKAAAEALLQKLGESGCRIVIAADGLPLDEKTHQQSFLGVRCYPISFENGYPDLKTQEGSLSTDLFPQGYTSWQTVYVQGLDKSLGQIDDNGFQLDFYGTVHNENIVFVGLNLMYYYGLTQNEDVGKLLGQVLQLSQSTLPERKIVPLTVTYDKNRIQIISPEDHVNTTLAYHDLFKACRQAEAKNHLTYVNSGTTVITLHYPYLKWGAAVSLISLGLMGAWIGVMRKKEKGKADEGN